MPEGFIGNVAGGFYGGIDYPLTVPGLNLGHNYTQGYVLGKRLAGTLAEYGAPRGCKRLCGLSLLWSGKTLKQPGFSTRGLGEKPSSCPEITTESARTTAPKASRTPNPVRPAGV